MKLDRSKGVQELHKREFENFMISDESALESQEL